MCQFSEQFLQVYYGLSNSPCGKYEETKVNTIWSLLDSFLFKTMKKITCYIALIILDTQIKHNSYINMICACLLKINPINCTLLFFYSYSFALRRLHNIEQRIQKYWTQVVYANIGQAALNTSLPFLNLPWCSLR